VSEGTPHDGARAPAGGLRAGDPRSAAALILVHNHPSGDPRRHRDGADTARWGGRRFACSTTWWSGAGRRVARSGGGAGARMEAGSVTAPPADHGSRCVVPPIDALGHLDWASPQRGDGREERRW
jgi:hypothetical protein